MKTQSVWCHECDHEHECAVVSGEFEDYTDVPDVCEACGASLMYDEPIFREDFHADG